MTMPHGARWPEDPLVTAGEVFTPLAFDPCAEISTPEAQRIYPEETPGNCPGTNRMYGDIFWPPDVYAPAVEAWAEEVAKQLPWGAPERVQFVDRFSCQTIEPAELVPAGFSVELARFRMPRYGSGKLERIGLYVQADALDEGGEPIATYVLDGTNPCALPLAHPDAEGGTLTMQFRVVNQHRAGVSASPVPPWYRGAAIGVPSQKLFLTPWADMRYGWVGLWPTGLKLVIGASSITRLFATASGISGRWQVRVAGRLTAWWQLASGDAGWLNATHRVS